LRTQDDCKNSVQLPFIKASVPLEVTPCGSGFASMQGKDKPQDSKVSDAKIPDTKAEAKPEAKPVEEKKSWFRSLFN
jgi:hypothetical protein